MRSRQQWLAGLTGAAVAAGLLVGCGTGDGDVGGVGEPVVMGTTDEMETMDPATSYGPTWLLFNNVFQTLLSFPRGATSPEPDAARTCGFEDSRSTVYSCELKEGLKFSNGHSLTSEDVAHSFRRLLRINDPKGPAMLFSSVKEIETPDDKTITFRLKSPDATLPLKIASPAGSIVDEQEYPADRLRTDNKVFGSGVYTLDSLDKKQAVFSVNANYRGPSKLQNSGMTLKFFHGDQAALKDAVHDGGVDLAYRGLAAKDIADLEESSLAGDASVKVVSGASAEVMHLVFNMDDPVTGKLGVRKAVAYLIDRQALVRDAYSRTAKPLYSVIPAGITGHRTPFFDTYGERPQRDRAAAALSSEGITGKVELTLWATPIRFGAATVPAFEEIAQQLNASGLFDAKVRSLPLEAYQKGMAEGKFGAYVRGWVPDYPDPDNFVTPFFSKENVLSNNYVSKRIGELIPQTVAEADRVAAGGKFEEIQSIVADDLPVLPLWQGKQYAVARENVFGIEWSLDASTVPRFWEISKSSEE